MTEETAHLPGQADDQGWRRLHPVTPFLRSWKIIAAILVIAAQQAVDDLIALVRNLEGGLSWAIVGGIALLVLTVIGGWAGLSWKMTRYRVHGDTLEHEVGILFRQHRQARLERLQAVDVVQPLLGRIFGLSELRLEVAGGRGSDIKLQYLRDDDADQLRNVLLARAAGVSYTGPQAPAAPEQQLVSVPLGRLIGSLALSPGTIASLIMLVGVAVGTLFAPPAALTSIPIILGVVSAIWAQFTRGFNFTAAISPDGLRLRHGLLETRTQTVPPGRVQAVCLVQPLLWRRMGWWQLKVNVAGYAPGEDGEQSPSSVLLPVGTSEEAFVLLAQVLPDLGVGDPIALLRDGMTGVVSGDDEDDRSADAASGAAERAFTCAPRRSRWLDPISWRRNGFRITRTAMLIRSGRLVRRLDVVPHARTQSLGMTQGWLQRRLRLASVVAHSTPGPVQPRVRHLDQQVAGELLIRQATRAQQARRAAPRERWMSRVDLVKHG